MKRMENGRRSTVYRGLYQAKGVFPSLITRPIHPVSYTHLDVYKRQALSFALPYDPKDVEFVGVEVKNMKNMENLTNDRLHTNGTKSLYLSLIHI